MKNNSALMILAAILLLPLLGCNPSKGSGGAEYVNKSDSEAIDSLRGHVGHFMKNLQTYSSAAGGDPALHQMATSYGLKVELSSTMKPNVIAQCILQIGPGNDPGSVVGRRIVWNRAYLGRPEEFIWEVMHHEAGHCILYRGHDEALAMVPLNNQTVLAPKSMMYPSPINMVVESGTILLGQNLNYYLTELFTLGQFGNIFDDDGSNASTDRSVILPDTIQTLVFESTINGCQIRAK